MTENTNPTTATSTAAPAARQSLDRWLIMWNTDGEIAREICVDDFRIHFAVTEPDGSTPADAIRTADDFARYLAWWHEQNPEVVFTHVADAIDGDHGRLLWDVARAGRQRAASTSSTSPRTDGSDGCGPSAAGAACAAEVLGLTASAKVER